MDPKDVKPGRPSLLSAADSGTVSTASGPRILADMETGSGRKARTGVRKPRPLLLLLGVCTIAVLAGYYFLAASGWEIPAAPAVAVAEPSAPATESVRPDAVAASGTAADAESLPGPFDSLSARSDDPAEFPLSDLLEVPATAAGTPLVAAHTPSRAAKATPRKRASADSKKRAASRSEAPLMASLLKNIEQDKITASAARSLPQPTPAPPPAAPVPAAVTPATPASARDHDAMDALVQQVSKGKTVASAPAAGDRTQTVQSALRKCPRANTRAGLRCREQVCSKFRGQDRACPN